MIRHILHIIFFGAIMVGAFAIGFSNSSEVRKYARLVELNTKAPGVLQDQYEEVTMTIKGAKIITYNFKYDFTYKGQPYTGRWTATKLPDDIGVLVYLDPSNPTINAVNPQKKLDANNAGGGKFFYIVGLVALLIVLFKIFRIKSILSKPKASLPTT